MASFVFVAILVRVVMFWVAFCGKIRENRYALFYVWLVTLVLFTVFVVIGLCLIPTRLKNWDVYYKNAGRTSD